jgi:hypothetical protein
MAFPVEFGICQLLCGGKLYAVTAKALAMPERIWGGMETHVPNLAGRKFWWSETEIDLRQRTG